VRALKTRILPLIALLAVPALAQERWEVGLGANFNPSETATYSAVSASNQASASVAIKRASKVAPAIHVGYRIFDFNHSDLSVTGEYQFKTNYAVTTTANATVAGTSISGTDSDKFSSQFFAPGIQWNFHRAVDFGFGLQYRFAKLQNQDGDLSTRYNRPWLTSYVGYTFKQVEVVKPFVALRLAASPVTTKTPTLAAGLGDNPQGNKQLMKSLAGNVEISLQAGVRF